MEQTQRLRTSSQASFPRSVTRTEVASPSTCAFMGRSSGILPLGKSFRNYVQETCIPQDHAHFVRTATKCSVGRFDWR